MNHSHTHTKKSAIVASGQINSPQILRPLILKHERIIAADGGLIYCHQMGITPSLIVGDFDSCPQELLSLYPDVPKLKLHVDKDETDLEVAIKNEEGAVTLFGAWGKRIDHSLCNLLLLTRWPEKLKIETEDELLFAIQKSTYFPCSAGQTLSLFPINGVASGVKSKGLKWELQNIQLDKDFFSISNICVSDHVELSLESGQLICVLNKRKELS
jgi:thiamine pyrophosphokinase